MKPTGILLVGALMLPAAPPPDDEERLFTTFSIVCRDPRTGDFGVGVTTMPQAVRQWCPFARAGVGAVCTQAFTNKSYGPKGLDLMAAGKTPAQAIQLLTDADRGRDQRQVGMIDGKNPPAAYTGSRCMAWCGHLLGKDYTVQGNLLVGEDTLKVCARTFEETPGSLAGRIIKALRAGKKAGGDKRGHSSCAVIVASKRTDKELLIDLSEDNDKEPVESVYKKWLETCTEWMELGDRELKAGDAGGDVRQLREALGVQGEAVDDALLRALREFQKANGLKETGTTDPDTVKSLLKKLER